MQEVYAPLDFFGEGIIKYTKMEKTFCCGVLLWAEGTAEVLPGAYVSRIHESCWDFRQVRFPRIRQSSKVGFGVYM